jgi:sugar lactone lactonase YvrE
MRRRRLVLLLVPLLLITVGGAAFQASAAGSIRTLALDPGAVQHPEGIAIDKAGTIFIGLAFTGEILAIARDGTVDEYATVPVGAEGFGPLGIAVDSRGTLYVAVATFDPETSGIYVLPRRGDASRIPGTEALVMPNDLTLDSRGNLYATDSISGHVWRIPRSGTPELWADDALLFGDPAAPIGFPVGANGVATWRGHLYVAVTEHGRIVRIPIRPDGGAGTPEIFVEDVSLLGVDGIAFDVHGNLHAALLLQSRIVRISPDGSITEVATAEDGVDYASTIAFGTGMGERKTLYWVNFAIGQLFFGELGEANPGLFGIEVDVPGAPVP